MQGDSPKDLLKTSDAKISFKKTVSMFLFGNSIPIAFFPYITETLADFADIDLAISSKDL